MEYKIGEVITLCDGRKVKVVEAHGSLCTGCALYDHDYDCVWDSTVNCCDSSREDGINIIYEEIEED